MLTTTDWPRSSPSHAWAPMLRKCVRRGRMRACATLQILLPSVAPSTSLRRKMRLPCLQSLKSLSSLVTTAPPRRPQLTVCCCSQQARWSHAVLECSFAKRRRNILALCEICLCSTTRHWWCCVLTDTVYCHACVLRGRWSFDDGQAELVGSSNDLIENAFN